MVCQLQYIETGVQWIGLLTIWGGVVMQMWAAGQKQQHLNLSTAQNIFVNCKLY